MISQNPLTSNPQYLSALRAFGLQQEIPVYLVSGKNPSTIGLRQVVNRIVPVAQQGTPLAIDSETVEVTEGRNKWQRVELLQIYLPEGAKATTGSETHHGIYLVHGYQNIANLGNALRATGIHSLNVIVHNPKFELDVLSRVSGFPLLKVLWDTMDMPTVGPRGLRELVLMYFGHGLSKDSEIRQSNWAGQLSAQQIEYAAMDAVATYALYDLYQKKTRELEVEFLESGLLDRAYDRLRAEFLEPEICSVETAVWMEYLVSRLEDVNNRITSILKNQLRPEIASLITDAGRTAPSLNKRSRNQAVRCLSLLNLQFLGINLKITKVFDKPYPYPDDFFKNPLRQIIFDLSGSWGPLNQHSALPNENFMDEFLKRMYENSVSELWLERAILIDQLTQAAVRSKEVQEIEKVGSVLEPEMPCINSEGEIFLIRNPWLETVHKGRNPFFLTVRAFGRRKPFHVVLQPGKPQGNPQQSLFEAVERSLEPKLRPDQLEAVEQLVSGKSVALLQGPTGSGKTITALSVGIHLLKLGDYKLVILSAPNKTLAKQWYNEYTQKFPNSPYPGILLDADESANWAFSKPCFVFCTFNTASAVLARLEERVRRKSFVVLDEVHQACGDSYGGKLLQDCRRFSVGFVLGVSATPRKDKFMGLLGRRENDITVARLDPPHRISEGQLWYVELTPFERYLERVFLDNLESVGLSWQGSYKDLLNQRNDLQGYARRIVNDALAAYNLLKICLSGGQEHLEATIQRLETEINERGGIDNLLASKRRKFSSNLREGKKTPGLHLDIFLLEHWRSLPTSRPLGNTEGIIRQIIQSHRRADQNTSVIVAVDSVPCANGLDKVISGEGFKTCLLTGATNNPRVLKEFLKEPGQVLIMTEAGFAGLDVKGLRCVYILPGLLDNLERYLQAIGRVRDDMSCYALIPETPVYSQKYSLALKAVQNHGVPISFVVC